jgi:hypothetical protein
MPDANLMVGFPVVEHAGIEFSHGFMPVTDILTSPQIQMSLARFQESGADLWRTFRHQNRPFPQEVSLDAKNAKQRPDTVRDWKMRLRWSGERPLEHIDELAFDSWVDEVTWNPDGPNRILMDGDRILLPHGDVIRPAFEKRHIHHAIDIKSYPGMDLNALELHESASGHAWYRSVYFYLRPERRHSLPSIQLRLHGALSLISGLPDFELDHALNEKRDIMNIAARLFERAGILDDGGGPFIDFGVARIDRETESFSMRTMNSSTVAPSMTVSAFRASSMSDPQKFGWQGIITLSLSLAELLDQERTEVKLLKDLIA